ncbi:MAG: conjugal transfer protein TraF [Candidatus Aminicenantes bacterium]|nr:conjugal transfer protein TraF [Candidatus Aminicenantes bacterium]
MRRFFLLLMAFVLCRPALAFIPFFHGARSLALGYSTRAFNYDLNAAFINPAMLAALGASLGGYQYQQSVFDFRDSCGRLAGIDVHELEDFQALAEGRKSEVLGVLKEVFASTTALSGFQVRHPGYAGRGYAVAVAFVDAAVVHPLSNPVLDKPASEISNADIASLEMRFIGFHYSDYSLSLAFPVSRALSMGATAHYLKGRNVEFKAPLASEPLRGGVDAHECLQSAWTAADNDFSKFSLDLGFSAEFNPYFRAALTVKNATEPAIATGAGELRLARRVVAGLAFRPDRQLGLYMDVDLSAGDLYHNGHDVQPLSIGVEKGLFENRLFLRVGLLGDLAAKYFLGSRANVLYGLGLGFNLGNFLVDLAMGLDPLGRIKSLGVSGFYLLGGKN